MLNDILSDPAIKQVVEEIAETAGILWDKGWAERNAGNISVNITTPGSVIPLTNINPGGEIPLPQSSEVLSGQVFIVTGAGTRMRDVAKDPGNNLCFIKINKSGTGYTHLCFKPGPGRTPTSELPSHLAIHKMLLQMQPASKAVVHTHSTELIALTQIPDFKAEEKINHLLWSMHPETLIFVPQGAGFIPYTIPGTLAIAGETVKALESHPAVIWEKHGVFATGTSVPDAFDTIDLLAKSARVFFTCRNAGYDPEGLTESQLNDIRRNYHL